MRPRWSCLPSPWSGNSLIIFSERLLSDLLPNHSSVPSTAPRSPTPFLPSLLDVVKERRQEVGRGVRCVSPKVQSCGNASLLVVNLPQKMCDRTSSPWSKTCHPLKSLCFSEAAGNCCLKKAEKPLCKLCSFIPLPLEAPELYTNQAISATSWGGKKERLLVLLLFLNTLPALE